MIRYIQKERKALKTAENGRYDYLKAWLLPLNILITLLGTITLFNYGYDDMLGAVRMLYFFISTIGIRIIIDFFLADSQGVIK